MDYLAEATKVTFILLSLSVLISLYSMAVYDDKTSENALKAGAFFIVLLVIELLILIFR